MFIKFLENSNKSIYFAKVSVDKNSMGQRNKLVYEYQITQVPSIIVEDTKYVGKNAFIWLENFIKNEKYSQDTSMASGFNKKILSSIKKQVKDEEINNVSNTHSKKRKLQVCSLKDSLKRIRTIPEEEDKLNKKFNKMVLNKKDIPDYLKDMVLEKQDKLKEKHSTNDFNKIVNS